MSNCHETKNKKKIDILLWASTLVLWVFYLIELFISPLSSEFSKSIFELLNTMWIWMSLWIIFVWILDKIPREFIVSILWKSGSFSSILRATWAWVLLDLCSHWILMVWMKLYERWASLWQTMAFLIASPWNSISLTLILWALIWFKLTLLFILLSMLIAIISWLIFDLLVKNGTLPKNKNEVSIPKNFDFFEIKKHFSGSKLNLSFLSSILLKWLSWSKVILKWVFFWIILASLVRNFVSPENFQTFFGPTIAWLWLTVIVATIMEICSEGSSPMAADLTTRASAPGNSFAFLMTWVSTDYTEIFSIKETAKSWKIALFLPLITLPQIIIISFLINKFS